MRCWALVLAPILVFAGLSSVAREGDKAEIDAKAREALSRMAQQLGRGLALLITGLAPDVIVVIGEITRAWPQVGPIIAESVKRNSFTRTKTRIVPSDPSSQPRLRGTIALVLQKHFGAPSVA